jgi:hypothetical protein
MRRLISSLVTSAKARRESNRFYRDWERAAQSAVSPAHRADIDAAFTRHHVA